MDNVTNSENVVNKINTVLKELQNLTTRIEKGELISTVSDFNRIVNNIMDIEEACLNIKNINDNLMNKLYSYINKILENLYEAYERLDSKYILMEMKNSLANGISDLNNKISLIEKINKFPFWYHKIELTDGIVTPGWAPLNREMYGIPQDMTGLRVLDVGAWDGFWTFEALKRGAKQVVAIDDFSDFLGKLENSDRKAWETFDLCKEAFGYTDEQCQRYDMSVYDISEELLGRFDVVFFFGVLYHLRHPLLALDKASALCDGEIYVETAILDDCSIFNGGLGHGYTGNQVVAEFYSGNQYGTNDTNWWVPSLQCLGHMLLAAGFQDIELWKLKDKPDILAECRGFAHGVKKSTLK